MTACVSTTPENDRSFHANSHDTGASLFLAIAQSRAEKWHMAKSAYRADYWMRWAGTGWTSVKRFGFGAAKDFTYFIRFDLPTGECPIKIGVARHPYSRLSGLRTGSPYPMSLLAVYPNEILPEVMLHEVFADSRLNGEWFSPTPLLLSLADVARVAHPLHLLRARASR